MIPYILRILRLNLAKKNRDKMHKALKEYKGQLTLQMNQSWQFCGCDYMLSIISVV